MSAKSIERELVKLSGLTRTKGEADVEWVTRVCKTAIRKPSGELKKLSEDAWDLLDANADRIEEGNPVHGFDDESIEAEGIDDEPEEIDEPEEVEEDEEDEEEEDEEEPEPAPKKGRAAKKSAAAKTDESKGHDLSRVESPFNGKRVSKQQAGIELVLLNPEMDRQGILAEADGIGIPRYAISAAYNYTRLVLDVQANMGTGTKASPKRARRAPIVDDEPEPEPAKKPAARKTAKKASKKKATKKKTARKTSARRSTRA